MKPTHTFKQNDIILDNFGDKNYIGIVCNCVVN